MFGIRCSVLGGSLLRDGCRPSKALHRPRTECRIPILGALILAGLTGPSAARAQEPVGASRYLPLGHWANVYIDRLRDRGYLETLNPLVRPYRRGDVARALSDLRPRRLLDPERAWVELLRREFAPELGGRRERTGYAVGGELVGGVRAANTDRLDPLRPTGDGKAWPNGELGGWLEAGPVAAASRVRSDAWFPDDPDGQDVGRRLEARSEEAYVSAQFLIASVFVGRIARNWGPWGGPGLMLSDEPATYPQLGFELRAGPLSWSSVLAELDTVRSARRWLGAHRLDLTPTPDFTVSLGEAILYGAPGAGLAPRFLNPVAFFFFDHDNAPRDYTMNLMLDLQFWFRKPGLVLYGEGLLDDIDLNPPKGVTDREPSQYAVRGGIRLPGVSRRADLSLDYTLVSAYAYRTLSHVDDYLYLRRGLADNFADFDRLGLRVDLHVGPPGLMLTPTLTYQRQGEGNVRSPLTFGIVEWRRQPSLFLGVRERTVRAGLAGRYQPTTWLWAEWDLGENFVSNAGHVSGVDRNQFVALGAAGVRFSFR